MVSPLKAPPLASFAAKVPVISPSAVEVTWKRVTVFVSSAKCHVSSTPFVVPPMVNVAFPVAFPLAE